MRNWTERHIIELIHKVWDKLKKDLKNSGEGNPFKGVYLNLYSVLSTEVRPLVGVWNNGGISLTSRYVPIFIKEYIEGHGIKYERTEFIQVIKISDVYPKQWDYLYGNIGTKPHLIIYQSDITVGGGYRKEIYSEKDNFFIRSLKNFLNNGKGIINKFSHSIPNGFGTGNLKAYSGIDMESYVEITVRELDRDRANGYTLESTSPLSKIQTWKFSGKLPHSTCWVFAPLDSGRILTKEERLEAVKRFNVDQEYQKETIDLGEIGNETN